MNIRPARMDDLDTIVSIESACFPAAEAAGRASIQKRLSVFPEHFYLMEYDNQIIGFVNGFVTDLPDLTDIMYDQADLHNESGSWQMIFGLDVLPKYRNHGNAAALLDHIIEQARVQKRSGLVLTCKNHLVRYYAKFGFQDEGISVSTHGNVSWHQMRLSF